MRSLYYKIRKNNKYIENINENFVINIGRDFMARFISRWSVRDDCRGCARAEGVATSLASELTVRPIVLALGRTRSFARSPVD
jgi:hypothetical protein